MKLTEIWGSDDITKVRARTCDGVTCRNLVEGDHDHSGHRKHRVRLSSPHQSISNNLKYRIPEALVRELAGFGGKGEVSGPRRSGRGRVRQCKVEGRSVKRLTAPPPPPMPEPEGSVQVSPWLLEPAGTFTVGEVRERDMDHRQVVVKVRAKGSRVTSAFFSAWCTLG